MRHRFMAVCLALALGALAGALACSENTVTQPEPAMHMLSGRVTEGGFPLAQARVEVSAAWGKVSKLTDGTGSYSGLMASGDVTARAEKEGFSAEVRQLTVDHDQMVNFELQRVDTPGDPQGVYRLTFTASPSCTTLPAEARQRDYWARIDRTGDDLIVTLREGDFLDSWSEPGFTGTRDGSTARFTIDEWEVAEVLGSETYLTYWGTAAGTIGERSIHTVFDGTVRVGTYNTTLAQCRAGDHRLEFVR